MIQDTAAAALIDSARDPVTNNAKARPIVIVATKGRAPEVAVLVDQLLAQTLSPQLVLLVGTSEEDLPEQLPSSTPEITVLGVISPKVGLTRQRNFGLDWVKINRSSHPAAPFIAFFDDDFRLHPTWLEACRAKFDTDPAIVGISGWVLADGIKTDGITEAEAKIYIEGLIGPMAHWTDRPDGAELESAYGCNMAFRSVVYETCRFDDQMPLYGWQEDTDFTGQTRPFGKTIIARDCKGVHLGVKSARTSGVRLGYSQIANPLRIAGRGNMRKGRAARFVFRALAANTLKSFTHAKTVDYPGRLFGNLVAFKDILIGRCHPARIMDFK